LGERASNLFGVLLSLTFFSVLLAVMLVAVSVLPDGTTLAPAPPTLRGETNSRPVRTPPPVTFGDLELAQTPTVVPAGAALASVTFTTSVIPPPTGPSGAVTAPGEGPTRGPGFGVDDGIRVPGSTRTDRPGKSLGGLKKKGESGHPKRGPGFLRCDEEIAAGKKGKAKGRCDEPGDATGSGNGRGRGKGSWKGGSSGGGSVQEGGSSGGHGRALGHVKARGNGHKNGHNKAHSRFSR
jgi:uncharacterized membrane protein YgcG